MSKYLLTGTKWRSLNEIYRLVKKRPGRARILSSALVTLKGGQQAKLVFVRERWKKDWLSLLTTDTSLDDSEVVRLYGKRWDIARYSDSLSAGSR